MSKLVAGVGIRDKGLYQTIDNGIRTKEYRLWKSVLERCQPGGSVHKNNPCYIGCTVHQDFIKFQDFASWCNKQIGFNLDGFHLDKDILKPGNMVYGPDVCVFVPNTINTLLTYNRSLSGEYPPGVCFESYSQRYKASLRLNGTYKHIGRFDTPEAAFEAYKVVKLAEIHRQANMFKDSIDPRTYHALMKYEISDDRTKSQPTVG